MGKLFKIALALFLIGIGLYAIFAIASDDPIFGSVNEEDYEYNELTYDADEFTDFDFIFDNRSFVIRQSEDDQIKITYYTTEHDLVTVNTTNDTLELYNDIDWFFNIFSGWNFLSNNDFYTVYMYLPDSVIYNLDIDSSNGSYDLQYIDNLDLIKLDTSNGRITLSDVTANKVDLATSNGGITLTDLTVDDQLDVYTSNGGINLTNVTVDNEINVDTSNGKIILNNVIAATIIADSSNQSITATNITATRIDLDTSNGRIDVTINGDKDDYEVNMSTSNGDLTYDGIGVSQEHFNLGAIYEINLESSNGDVTIEFTN